MNVQDMQNKIAEIVAAAGSLNCEELQQLWDALDVARNEVYEMASKTDCDWAAGPLPFLQG